MAVRKKLSDKDLLNFARDIVARTPEQDLFRRYKTTSSASISRWKTWAEKAGYLPKGFARRRKPQSEFPPEPILTVRDPELDCSHLSASCIVGSDPHIPGHDCLWIYRMVLVRRHYGIKHLAWAGDWHNTGAGNPFGRDKEAHFVAELDLSVKVDEYLARQGFEEIYHGYGNHELWLDKMASWELGYADLYQRMETIAQWTSFHHLYLGDDAHGIPIQAIHPDNYSKVPLSVAKDICETDMMHTLCAHTHHQAFGWGKQGVFWCADTGHLSDERRFGYKAKKKSRHPKWNSGFVMLLDGYPHFFGNHTDWSLYD